MPRRTPRCCAAPPVPGSATVMLMSKVAAWQSGCAHRKSSSWVDTRKERADGPMHHYFLCPTLLRRVAAALSPTSSAVALPSTVSGVFRRSQNWFDRRKTRRQWKMACFNVLRRLDGRSRQAIMSTWAIMLMLALQLPLLDRARSAAAATCRPACRGHGALPRRARAARRARSGERASCSSLRGRWPPSTV